ncbi:facilitated trehalose transporter Tret1-2 homolog [Chelonus insularis]|uniref:facilitated trehalose transporter Tret1-2 homolog n=1 Tax=Chelonus insularis TaxID=460826 RepID=UPI00158B6946|nr:facilitated trehalose transporter Tret1-2 homolog [Chelonus insularis]
MMNESNQVVEMKVELSSAEEQRLQKRRGLIYQMIMSLFANVSILGPAMSLGYSAVILPTLRSGESDLTVDENQASWIAGAAAFGTPIGCILSSFIMRRGRRLSLMVTSTFSLIGWLLIYMAPNYEKLVVGRVVSGVATGLASVPATVYTAEIATPAWRSTMVTWSSISIALGILLVYVFGYIIQDNWRLIALMCSLFPTVAIILIILAIPESPIWLRNKGRLDEARVVMKKFRGVPKNHSITVEIEKELYNSQNNINNSEKRSLLKHLTKTSSLKPFFIMLAYFFFQQFSGIFVVVFYAVDITAEAGIKMDAYLGAILIGITRLAGSILVACASKKWGRRIPSIASGIGMTLCMGILSIYLFLVNRGHFIGDRGLIPAICVLVYIFMSTIGFLTLPFAMVGEIFPVKVKDILSGISTCAAYIFSFITVKSYPDMLNSMGKHGVFLFYALASLAGTIFVIFCLPETKGKTLHEIDELFSKKRRFTLQIQEEKEKMFPPKDSTTDGV